MADDDLEFAPAEESAASDASGFKVGGAAPAAGAAKAELSTRTLAELYMKQGHFAKAAPIWAGLLAQNPSDAGVLARLSECQRQMAAGGSSLPAPAVASESDRVLATLERWLATARRMQGASL